MAVQQAYMEDSMKPIKNAYVVAISRLHLHVKVRKAYSLQTTVLLYSQPRARMGHNLFARRPLESLPSHGGLSYDIGTRTPWSTSVLTVSSRDSTDYCNYQLRIYALHIRARVMSVVKFQS